jgi:nucleoredoxin
MPTTSLVMTKKVVRGRTVIGLFFSADQCPPCQHFTPLLTKLHANKQAHCTPTNRNIPPFKVVLVSRCHDAEATYRYFATMPWAAMTHAAALGELGTALRDRFSVTTIPALIILDGEGTVICSN